MLICRIFADKADIEQVHIEKKVFILRCMCICSNVIQGRAHPWHQAASNA
jgi:hypothetical protein